MIGAMLALNERIWHTWLFSDVRFDTESAFCL
jgi:hypothetical protein